MNSTQLYDNRHNISILNSILLISINYKENLKSNTEVCPWQDMPMSSTCSILYRQRCKQKIWFQKCYKKELCYIHHLYPEAPHPLLTDHAIHSFSSSSNPLIQQSITCVKLLLLHIRWSSWQSCQHVLCSSPSSLYLLFKSHYNRYKSLTFELSPLVT